jgi:hypothetical protein
MADDHVRDESDKLDLTEMHRALAAAEIEVYRIAPQGH